MNKKTQLAISMGLLFSSGTVLAQPTDPIGIDWNGDGSGFDTVGALDWSVGSSYADGAVIANQEFQATGGACAGDLCQFDVYTHAALQGYVDDGGNPRGISGLNSDFEWTFISGLTEKVVSVADSIVDTGADVNGNDILAVASTQQFNTDGFTQNNFFFEIYYDTNVNSDALSGAGYADGQLILSWLSLSSASGNFSSNTIEFEDVDSSGGLSAGDVVLNDPTDPNFPFALLDSFGTDDWSNVDITYYSVEGEGGTTLEADVGTYDADFFSALGAFSIISDLVFSTENVDPFLETNPSQSYDTSAGGATQDTLGGGDILLGDLDGSGDVVNGSSPQSFQDLIDGTDPVAFAGEDVLFQTDANQGFRSVQIPNPEPGTLALLGLSLGFLSLGRRRRNRKA